jgi:uncharacterized membrane protein
MRLLLRNADLVAIVAVTLAVLALVLAEPISPAARVALGLPLVLLFPGYALLAALLPRRDDIDAWGRLGLSAGLSLAVVALTGLALNYSTWGLSLQPLLAFTALPILLASVIAAVRRQLAGADGALAAISPPLTVRGVLAVAAVVVATGAVLGGGAYLALQSSGQPEGFTEFYALAPAGGAGGYPSRLTEGEEARLVLGIVNHEGEESSYRIAALVGASYQGAVRSLRLEDGEAWEGVLTLELPDEGRQRLEMALYRNDEAAPYRSLRLWLTMEPAGPAFVEEAPAPEPAALSVVATPAPTPIPTPEPTPEPTPVPAPTSHTVTPGEYLTLIAALYGLPLDALIAANDLPDPDLIHPNQIISLAAGGE